MDAEEADRLEISLDMFAAVLADPRLRGWDGLGLAVQAYQKRALPLVDWVAALASAHRHRIPVRLVKGAYWDSEIKLAQVQGHADYPVFTRKAATDVSWLACARRMLERAMRSVRRSPRTTRTAWRRAGSAGDGDFEMQRLHGMGEALYHDARHAARCASMRRSARTRTCWPIWCAGCWRTAPIPASCIGWSIRRCRRRRSSRIRWRGCARSAPARNPRIPLPRDLYPDRVNSAGIDLADRAIDARRCWPRSGIDAAPRAASGRRAKSAIPPIGAVLIGHGTMRAPAEIDAALDALARGWREWDEAGGAHRADGAGTRRRPDRGGARRIAVPAGARGRQDPGRRHRRNPRGGGFLPLVRAARARDDFAAPRELPGPTGERNTWALGGRGVFAAISPWNFPLAIFTGQVAAALAAGNAVAAKPAEQTPLIAARAVALLHQAGVPRRRAGAAARRWDASAQALVNDPRIAGVAFTGGTETAQVDRAGARRAARTDRAVHRRDRRDQRDDRRQLRAAGTGGHRRAGQRVRLGGPALFGAAAAVPAGRHRRPRAAHAAGRGGDAGRSAIRWIRRPMSGR